MHRGSRIHRLGRGLAALVLVVALGSCDALLAPTSLKGTYALTRISDGSLPFVAPPNPLGWEWTLYADTIVLGDGGRGERRRVQRMSFAGEDAPVETTVFPVRYYLRDGRLFLLGIHPETGDAFAYYRHEGFVIGGRRLTERVIGLWTYERVADR